MFCGLLALEGAPAVTRHTTIGIYNYFTACKAGIAHRSTCDEATRGVDEIFCGAIKQVSRNNRLNNVLNDIQADLFLVDVVSVLRDRMSTRLNSSHLVISYAVFCLKKKKKHYWCAL